MEKILLGSIADIQTGPFGSQLHKEDYVQDGTPIVTVEHLGNRVFTEQNLPMVSDADKERLNKYVLSEGDIVFSRVGSVDRCSYVDSNHSGWMFSGRCLRVRPYNAIYPLYLYYFFCMESTKQFVRNIAVGATMPSINTKLMGEIEVSVPSIDTQKRIAAILSAIDDKIELNTAINENLEQQAQAILKEFMNKYNYTLAPLAEIAEVIDCLHSKKPERVIDSNRQLLQLENIKDNGFLDLSYQFMISESDYNNWTRKCEIHEGDCVITNVGRIGAVAQAPRDTYVAMGRNMTCIRLKSQYRIPAFLITVLLSEHMKREIRYNTDEGTIMGALNVKNIPKLQFPFFDEKVMSKLESLLYALRNQFEENSLQNQRLSTLRDTLLPKLMNGEIDVSEVKL